MGGEVLYLYIMMQRCQLYLNLQSLKIIDQLADALTKQLVKKTAKPTPQLDKLIAKINFSQVTNLALKSDRNYL